MDKNVSRYLELKKKELIEIEDVYSQAQQAISIMRDLHRLRGLRFHPHRYDYKKLFKRIINESSIEFNFKDFLIACKPFNDNTNDFRILSKDLLTIRDLNLQNRIDDVTYGYFLLWFYASNFDTFINFLTPISKAIQQSHHYPLENRQGNPLSGRYTAEKVIEVFRHFDIRFHRILGRILNRDLRNKIAHNDFRITKRRVYFKGTWIQRDTLFRMLTLMSEVYNKLQILQFEYEIKYRKKMITDRVSERELYRFLDSYTLRG